MAKSLRAKTKKSNKTKLRNRVFGPIEAARTERLSTKLLKIATDPRPRPDETIMVDAEAAESRSATKRAQTEIIEALVEADDEMNVDGGVGRRAEAVKSIHTPKKRRGKASASIVFAGHVKKTKKVGSRTNLRLN